MVQLITASGPRDVGSWGIQLQGPVSDGGQLDVAALQAAEHDLLVIDFSADGTESGRYFAEDIHRLKARSDNAVVLAYLAIGAVFDYRSNWDRSWTSNGSASGQPTAAAPSWLGPVHPACANARLVRFWEDDWREMLIDARRTGWADLIAAQGFDGVYVDLVDGFALLDDGQSAPAGHSGRQAAARRMVGLIARLAGHVRQHYPEFQIVPANCEALWSAAGGEADRASLMDAISAVVAEDVFCPGGLRENNPMRPDAQRIGVLTDRFKDAGKPVFSLEYLDTPDLVAAYHGACATAGFVPYAAPCRDLDRLASPYAGDIAPAAWRPGELPAAPTRSGPPAIAPRPGDAPRFRWTSRAAGSGPAE